MNPVGFKQQTAVLAKDQPQYLPLPVFQDHVETISCWQLSWRERFKLLFGGYMWLRQCNFGQPLQPQRPTTEDPFEGPEQPADGHKNVMPQAQPDEGKIDSIRFRVAHSRDMTRDPSRAGLAYATKDTRDDPSNGAVLGGYAGPSCGYIYNVLELYPE